MMGAKIEIWRYDPAPLYQIQRIVEGMDWISEAYIFGGYARALLGYPPFRGREPFGPGHDIDVAISVKYPEAFEFMKRENIPPYTYNIMTIEEAWVWAKKELERGIIPLTLIDYMFDNFPQVGEYILHWTGTSEISFFEDRPIIRIKPKPIHIYYK